MIERYSIIATSEQLAERFSVDVPESYRVRYNAAPAQLLPVITDESPQGISFFYWGTSPEWTKSKIPGEKIINTRAEVIPEKPVLKKNLVKRRCIIPADGFYGWKKVGKKSSVPYRFTHHTENLFAIAGLWEEYDNDEGEMFHTFTMITTVSDQLVMSVAERMPCILEKRFEKLWLSKQTTEEQLITILTSTSNSNTRGYTIAPAINRIEADNPTVILPAPAADQFGNLRLFD
jgi:putative SOS response-associated peptidase YedK